LSEYPGLFLSTLADPLFLPAVVCWIPDTFPLNYTYTFLRKVPNMALRLRSTVRSGTIVGVWCDTNKSWANYKLPCLSSLRRREYHFRTISVFCNIKERLNASL
jgi:hypothetical protein